MPTPRQIMQDSEARRLFAALERLEPWLTRRQMELTRIPAPTGLEGPRAEWMLRQMRQLGARHPHLDAAGNVIGLRPGTEPHRPGILISAHLDTVFPPGTSLKPRADARHRLHAPGIADNGAGLAALLGVMKLLLASSGRLRHTLMFCANVGEEGEGNLKGMRYLFQHEPGKERISYSLVIDGAGCQNVTNRGLASQRILLECQGPGGHSWSDAGVPSAIHALQRCLAPLAALAPRPGRAVINIGGIEGGTSINSIAARAAARLDLRAANSRELARLRARVETALRSGVRAENRRARRGVVTGRLEVLGERPGGTLAANSHLWRTVRAVDAWLGLRTQPRLASTDANVPLALGCEAVTLGAGGASAATHTLAEWYDPADRIRGLQRILLLLLCLAEPEK